MKKKCLFSLFALTMLFSPLNIHAESRALATTCNKCGEVRTRTTNRYYEHEERFPCSHGKARYDVYDVYKVKTIDTCQNCGNTSFSEYEEHVFKKCSN